MVHKDLPIHFSAALHESNGRSVKGYLWSTASSYEYILGTYESPETIQEFVSWFKAGSVFYDLGGNTGCYALTANEFIVSGKIYSFEPLPAARKIFEHQMLINKKIMPRNNIQLLPFAISDSEKEVEFSDDRFRQQGNTYITGSTVFTAAENKITVQCHSIDWLLAQGYDKPDIMKIDVEGAEYDVLKGAINSLQRYKPNILLSTHDCHLPGVKDKCVNFLQELGYELKHTGNYNKHLDGLDDYIAIHQTRL